MADQTIEEACDALLMAKKNNCGLLVLTGAGMSVGSGVPVFRMSDGKMSAEFQSFLENYNKARLKAGRRAVSDWFSFSVPEMFKNETMKEAWQYWRWRILRAQVERGHDYIALDRIMDQFGPSRTFVITSNCDGLHFCGDRANDDANIHEIHGSLAYLQCSGACSTELWKTKDYLDRLQVDSDWVPMCPKCNKRCLRPNVMIFDDDKLVYDRLAKQQQLLELFQTQNKKWIVLEVGAGTVVPSIRYKAEKLASSFGGHALIRINPSRSECQTMASDEVVRKYYPIATDSKTALERFSAHLLSNSS